MFTIAMMSTHRRHRLFDFAVGQPDHRGPD
jgi:hypothetical protein